MGWFVKDCSAYKSVSLLGEEDAAGAGAEGMA